MITYQLKLHFKRIEMGSQLTNNRQYDMFVFNGKIIVFLQKDYRIQLRFLMQLKVQPSYVAF